MQVKIGKIPTEILNKIILNPINENKNKREDIIVRPKTGEDSSAVFIGDELCVISSDPITGTINNAGYLAVHINCNDIAASGCVPIGIMLTVLIPENSEESVLEEIMSSACEAARELDIEILGGHTEVTRAVNQPIISGTVIGKTKDKKFITSSGAIIGQDVIMTKWAGLEGTVIIARDYEEVLSEKIDNNILATAMAKRGFISVAKESVIAVEHGATSMHDATEGGILGALWEIAECSNTGIDIYYENIPILNETIEISNVAGIDPLYLISSGSLIITSFDGQTLVDKLEKEGINSAVIGKVTECDRRIIKKDGTLERLNHHESDELYKVNIKLKEGIFNER